MMWKTAINLTTLQENKRQTAHIEGHKILFIWHNEQVYAVQAQCPHLKLPLIKGKINDDCTLVCPFHHSEFNLKTGDMLCWSPWPPVVGPLLGNVSKPKNLRIYPTRIEKNEVLVCLEPQEENQ